MRQFVTSRDNGYACGAQLVEIGDADWQLTIGNWQLEIGIDESERTGWIGQILDPVPDTIATV
jgi:hypothetical protein